MSMNAWAMTSVLVEAIDEMFNECGAGNQVSRMASIRLIFFVQCSRQRLMSRSQLEPR
jgi:hypothetical protein